MVGGWWLESDTISCAHQINKCNFFTHHQIEKWLIKPLFFYFLDFLEQKTLTRWIFDRNVFICFVWFVQYESIITARKLSASKTSELCCLLKYNEFKISISKRRPPLLCCSTAVAAVIVVVAAVCCYSLVPQHSRIRQVRSSQQLTKCNQKQ